MSGDASKEVSPTGVAAENVERGDTYCTITNDENQIVCPINVPEQTPYILMQVDTAAVAVHERCIAWCPPSKMK